MKFLHILWNPEQKRLRTPLRLGLFSAPYISVSLLASFLINYFHLSFFLGNNGLYASIELLISLTVIMLSARFLDRRRFSDFGFHFTKEWGKDLVFGIGLGAILMALIFCVEWLAGWIKIEGFLIANTLSSAIPTTTLFRDQFLESILLYVCVALYEEMTFRGYLQKNLIEWFTNQRIKSPYPALIAIMLSSTLFSLRHLGNPHASVISTSGIFLAGIMLSSGLVLTDELAIPIGLHFSWNFFQGAIFGFPVSGTTSPANLIAIQQNGPEIVTGGQFGPEAGILGLAAMLTGLISIYLKTRNRENKDQAQ